MPLAEKTLQERGTKTQWEKEECGEFWRGGLFWGNIHRTQPRINSEQLAEKLLFLKRQMEVYTWQHWDSNFLTMDGRMSQIGLEDGRYSGQLGEMATKNGDRTRYRNKTIKEWLKNGASIQYRMLVYFFHRKWHGLIFLRQPRHNLSQLFWLC